MMRTFCFLYLMSLMTMVQANVITVKGIVRNADGTPAIKQEVKIQVYLAASATPCSEQVVVTDQYGHYAKELTCTGDIRRSRVSMRNCDGSALVLEKEVPASKTIEANFTMCKPAATACAPKFVFEAISPSATIPAFTLRFNSNTSEVAAGDKIVERSWEFRDGTPLLSNRVDPLHSFPRAGTYEVCLTIKTALGCEKKVCKAVVVKAVAPATCTAKFVFERLAPKKFRFTAASTTDKDDRITEVKWDFRDGESSNDLSPVHEYAKPGIYEVCMTIKTARGCERRVCAAVKVEEAPVENKAQIDIVSLYPSPVKETLKAVVASKNGNVSATISIINQDGHVQYTKQVTLVQGYNPILIPVGNLKAGTYAFKVSTRYGSVTKRFYKI